MQPSMLTHPFTYSLSKAVRKGSANRTSPPTRRSLMLPKFRSCCCNWRIRGCKAIMNRCHNGSYCSSVSKSHGSRLNAQRQQSLQTKYHSVTFPCSSMELLILWLQLDAQFGFSSHMTILAVDTNCKHRMHGMNEWGGRQRKRVLVRPQTTRYSTSIIV